MHVSTSVGAPESLLLYLVLCCSASFSSVLLLLWCTYLFPLGGCLVLLFILVSMTKCSPFLFTSSLSFSQQVVVVLIGTNNHGNTAEQVAEGIESAAWCIQSKLPSSKIVVLVGRCLVLN